MQGEQRGDCTPTRNCIRCWRKMVLHNTNVAGIPELGEVPVLAQDPQPLKVVEVFGEKTHVLTAAAHGSDGGMLAARVIVSDTKKQTTETQFHFSWTSVQDAIGKSVM